MGKVTILGAYTSPIEAKSHVVKGGKESGC